MDRTVMFSLDEESLQLALSNSAADTDARIDGSATEANGTPEAVRLRQHSILPVIVIVLNRDVEFKADAEKLAFDASIHSPILARANGIVSTLVIDNVGSQHNLVLTHA